MESGSSAQIIAYLKTCFERALDRRCVVKDSSEQWYALGAVRPSSGESSAHYGVRIPTVVEERQVDYVPVAARSRNVAGHDRHLSSPGKGKKLVSRSPIKWPRQFEVASPSASSRKRTVVNDPNLFSALASERPQGKTRKSERDKKAAPVFQGGIP